MYIILFGEHYIGCLPVGLIYIYIDIYTEFYIQIQDLVLIVRKEIWFNVNQPFWTRMQKIITYSILFYLIYRL